MKRGKILRRIPRIKKIVSMMEKQGTACGGCPVLRNEEIAVITGRGK
jgi:hypothetical protein